MIDKILVAARETLGTPFQHQGRLVGRGIDCAGVIVHVMRTLGLPYEDQSAYARVPRPGLLEAVLERQPNLAPTDDPQIGDVLLMQIRGNPQHLAIHAGSTIIHAYAEAGKSCEHGFTPEWRSRVVRAYRIRGAEFRGDA